MSGGGGGSPLISIFSLNCPAWPIQLQCLDFVYVCVPSQKTSFPVDWRLLTFLGSVVSRFFYVKNFFLQVFGLLRASFLCIMGLLAGRGLWLLVLVTSDWWHTTVTHDIWHMARDTWHMTCDTWHVTHDVWLFLHAIVNSLWLIYNVCFRRPNRSNTWVFPQFFKKRLFTKEKNVFFPICLPNFQIFH